MVTLLDKFPILEPEALSKFNPAANVTVFPFRFDIVVRCARVCTVVSDSITTLSPIAQPVTSLTVIVGALAFAPVVK